MLLKSQADYLIQIPKVIIEDNQKMDYKKIIPKEPFKEKIYMISDDYNSFMWEIDESDKKAFKFTLHFQEDDEHIPLLRIDYNSRHKNPEKVTDKVPEKFRPFTGQWLDNYPGHIHHYIEGFALKWAIPLELDDFPVKEIKTYDDIFLSVESFSRLINVTTKLNLEFQRRMNL